MFKKSKAIYTKLKDQLKPNVLDHIHFVYEAFDSLNTFVLYTCSVGRKPPKCKLMPYVTLKTRESYNLHDFYSI